MELPLIIKDDIVVCQQELRNAIAAHQAISMKLRKDPNNVILKARLDQAELSIRVVGRKQKPLIVRLRKELDAYQDKRKAANKYIDYDADNAYIAKQIQEYKIHKETNLDQKLKTKLRKIKKKRSSEFSDTFDKDAVELKYNIKEENLSRGNSTDDIEQPKSQILLDRRSNLLIALDKVYKQNAVPVAPVAPAPFVSVLPVISEPEPVLKEPSPAPEAYLDSVSLSPDPLPDLLPDTKEYFLRYLGLLNPEEYSILAAKRSERRKRNTISTVKREFIYDSFEITPKRKKKQYLQQVTLPTTRAQHTRASVDSNSDQNQNEALLGIKIPQELSIKKIKPKECIVCRLQDSLECLSSCESCDNYFHVNCHGRSPRGLKEDLCPTCIRRSVSPDMFTVLCLIDSTDGIIKRCFRCRSRGDLGSCKDSFTLNATQAEEERGVAVVPCASGWCGKILEGGETFKDEYGLATNRMCLQRGPSDSEDRCAYTVWNYKKVYMCFCQGDLCNNAPRSTTMIPWVGLLTAATSVSMISRMLI